MLESFIMPEIIENDTIWLSSRNNHKYDEDMWFEIDKNRDFLRTYMPWVDKTNSLQDCNSATDMFTDKWQKGTDFAYSIVLKSIGKAIGSIDVHNVDRENHSAEIGYWLAKEYNGLGYMTQAVKLIETEAFLQGLHRLVITTQQENTRSSNVAKRSGYIFEGANKDAIFNDNTFHDKLVFAKLKNS